jgi:hypothetical protein
MAPLELLFTGSVPLQPAAAVFEALQDHCGERLTRMPDGEQLNWVFGAWSVLTQHPAIDVQEGELMTTADTPFGRLRAPRFVIREGTDPEEICIERFGLADAIGESYRQLSELKARGVVAAPVRLQATLAGPGTSGGPLTPCTWEQTVAIVNPPLIAEAEAFADVVPVDELAVQIDIAAEIELEEWRRNPDGFEVPFAREHNDAWVGWTLEKLMQASAEIANRVPDGAELGFHLCGLWHIDPRGGQDLQVHVDAANVLTEQVERRIDYIHMPVLPEHGPDDYAKLADLRLAPETKLFLGLIHHEDGIEGAKRRIDMTGAVVEDFGVGHFCGLRDLNQVGDRHLRELLELHGQVARL